MINWCLCPLAQSIEQEHAGFRPKTGSTSICIACCFMLEVLHVCDVFWSHALSDFTLLFTHTQHMTTMTMAGLLLFTLNLWHGTGRTVCTCFECFVLDFEDITRVWCIATRPSILELQFAMHITRDDAIAMICHFLSSLNQCTERNTYLHYLVLAFIKGIDYFQFVCVLHFGIVTRV